MCQLATDAKAPFMDQGRCSAPVDEAKGYLLIQPPYVVNWDDHGCNKHMNGASVVLTAGGYVLPTEQFNENKQRLQQFSTLPQDQCVP